MTTYDAYLIIDANNPDDPDGVVWWDGKHVQASNNVTLTRLKEIIIPFGNASSDRNEPTATTIKSGKKFFDQLPLAFRSGYTYLKKAKVDESGKPV